MSPELALPLAVLGYLALLFLTAWAAERWRGPARLARHPLIHLFALGVYGGAWSLLGSIGFARHFGHSYLFYYLGMSMAFLLAPIFLQPLAQLVRTHQLNSLADVLAFRYRSRLVGALAALLLLFGSLPMVALQLKSVHELFVLLSHDGPAPWLLLGGFVLLLLLFTLRFGSRDLTAEQQHSGLLLAIASSGLLKLVAFGGLGWLALRYAFGDLPGLGQWLRAHPLLLDRLHQPMAQWTPRILLLLFFFATVLMPHIYHLLFAEGRSATLSNWLGGGFSLYLLLLSLPVLPILWAGESIGLSGPAEFFSIGLALTSHSPAILLAALLSTLAATSAVMVVATLALASICLNHLVLPFYQTSKKEQLYRWVLARRRWLIALIFLIGLLGPMLFSDWQPLAELALFAFVCILQLMPGTLGVLYWPHANRKGLVAGLLTGLVLWLLCALLAQPLTGARSLSLLQDNWSPLALGCLAINIAIFSLVSAVTSRSPAERAAAELCSVDNIRRPRRRELSQSSPERFIQQLSKALGLNLARQEVEQALRELELDADERRPYAMRRLRDRIEANLSGRLGPSTAQEIVSRLLPYKESPYAYDIEDINFIENRLESYRKDLRGLAAELDTLRRYHRQTLRDLPIGVLSIGVDGEVLLWNRAMEALTQTPAGEVIGSTLASLAPPWGALFADFLHDPAMQRHKEPIKLGGEQRWVALHKSDVSAEDVYQGGSQVILVEDMTDTRLLEQKLMHSERLASIGRLAAGVAHEIGNPVTGIDCLAQNLAAESDEAEIRELAEQIRQQIRRINRIVQSLVTFAHRGNPETPSRHGAVSLRACVAEAVELLSIGGKGYDIRFDNRCDPDLDVRGDSQRLQQVFVNLLDNARDASPPGACILIRSQLLEGMVQTEVIDQGSGIDKSLHERVFDPFFTTKEPGEGTGLGLALAYSIVEAHQGQLLIDSPLDAATGRGTKVTVLLPKWVESTQQSAQTDDSESETG